MQCCMLMKKSLLILIGALLLTGCDFFRMVAGRPTSAEIEAKKVELLAQKEEEALQMEKEREQKARQDSIEKRAKAVADSLDSVTYIAENKVIVYTVSRLGGMASDGLASGADYRFRIVVGSYREQAKADAMIAKVKAAGDFNPHQINLRNGMVAVAACPAASLPEVVAQLKKMRTNPVCPPDAWILKLD